MHKSTFLTKGSLALFCIAFMVSGYYVMAQSEINIQVKTLFELNASGGVTADKYGNIYIGDFGKYLEKFEKPTKVYKWNPKTEKLTVFAKGFKGASGACFDSKGNFYQSNNAGNAVSKVDTNGKVIHKWVHDTTKIKTPIGLEGDKSGNIYVANCGKNEIGKISPDGKYQTFAQSEHFMCPNGLTQDDKGNLYTCNFSDGKILKITPDGAVSVLAELPTLTLESRTIGNGHLIYSNGWLFVVTIGPGKLYRVGLDGSVLKIAGKHSAFKNTDGDASTATFNKPNGIATSKTGDTLYINVYKPIWKKRPIVLHPGKVVMVMGILSLPDTQNNWSKQQEEIIETINKFSQTTTPNGKGADAYAGFLTEDFSRWTIGSDSIDNKKSWVEGVRGWFDDGWRVSNRGQQIISIDIEDNEAFTRRIVSETYTGPDGEQSTSKAGISEVWVDKNGKWLLYRVTVKTLTNE
ncbi:SMP-30/gluconolactonase/LRE family protein [Galbibacter sp. EGI 63066]|uniref:SMP-30/gluconolactonase/LRE family protein n=1 Tax=Galbibacter sp. EGI 63066 TaxID=2993559 RepID=UPI0022493870|nr:SMP-30/gluconolactonase/LRE family protein [Galbibacter sp. EGI 63066]MCX2679808.1 SMP-30/gluconolactonase/LRE family protein [Galbibacter sp. EGI 63066]